MTDVVGAHFRGEEKMAQESINGLGYAMACILSGHDDVILYMGHCKESQTESRFAQHQPGLRPVLLPAAGA